MMFHSVSSFLSMGGNGLYVWLAYSATAIVLIWNLISPMVKKKLIISDLLQKMKREGFR